MLTFTWPWVCVLLPMPWAVRRFARPVDDAVGRSLRVPFFHDVMAMGGPGRTALTAERASWRFWAGIIVWGLLLIAAARPQWIGDPVALPVTGRDIMMAVDISGSMEIPDFALDGEQVDRLTAVKDVAGRFVEQRQGDRLGLVLFGAQAYVQTPLTFDRPTVRAMLNEAEIGLAGKETAIGDAIGLVIKRLHDHPQQHKVLILLTDGANTAGEVEPLQAAGHAAAEGIRIYTIGVGADEMRVRSLFGSRVVNPSRDLDEPTLKRIAKETGGVYLRAKDTAQLAAVYEELDRLEPSSEEQEVFRPKAELYIWPLGGALALSVVAALRLMSPAMGLSSFRSAMRRTSASPAARLLL